MMEALDRHEKIALQFSGGKDSLACLYLLQRDWSRITVCWTNTGDAFPETVAQMDAIRRMVPHFHEIRSDQPSNIELNGWPSEIVPTTNTAYGRIVDAHQAPLIQPYANCCCANIWEPMRQAMRDMGVTLLIRGTRIADKRKTLIRDGMAVDGIEFSHPIEDWSDAMVRDFLGDRLPAHYQHTGTSLDCRHCTAYLYENADKMRYMKVRHPVEHAEVMRRLRVIRDATAAELAHIDTAMEAA